MNERDRRLRNIGLAITLGSMVILAAAAAGLLLGSMIWQINSLPK